MIFGMKTRKTIQVQFNEVRNSGVFIAQTEANQKNSMSLLQQNGFRALTYQEALVKVDQNPKLKEQLKGKRFYLEGKGSYLSGYYTFNEKGKLNEGKGDIEKTVFVWKGSEPLSLLLHSFNYYGYPKGGLFVLDANCNPSAVARVVVGVRTDHEVATPKIKSLIRFKDRS